MALIPLTCAHVGAQGSLVHTWCYTWQLQHVVMERCHSSKQPSHCNMSQRCNRNRKNACQRRTLTATSWSLYSPRYTTP